MMYFFFECGSVAQWIRRLPTEQEIPGSIPGRIGHRKVFLYILTTSNDKLTTFHRTLDIDIFIEEYKLLH